MTGVQWTNWSRLEIIAIEGSPAGSSLAFNYEDGWTFSVGAECNVNADLTLRAGLGSEIATTTDQARSMRLPDADRFWIGAGASYNWDERLSIDIGYTHPFVEDAPANETISGIRYASTTEGSVDTISVGLRYHFARGAGGT